MSYIMKFQFWKNLTFFFYFFEIFLMIPNDKYTWEGQKFILCFITCSLHKKSTIKLKFFEVAISVNFLCHNPSLIESPSVLCVYFRSRLRGFHWKCSFNSFVPFWYIRQTSEPFKLGSTLQRACSVWLKVINRSSD